MATVFSDLKSLKVTSSFFPLFLSRKATGRRTPTLPSPASTGCRTNPRVFASGGRSSGIGWSCWVRSSLGWEHWEHWPGSTKIHSCFHSFRSRLISSMWSLLCLHRQQLSLAGVRVEGEGQGGAGGVALQAERAAGEDQDQQQVAPPAGADA